MSNNKARTATDEVDSVESPKSVFRRLPRPPSKPGHRGEDPKEFLRRMSQRARVQNARDGEGARAQ